MQDSNLRPPVCEVRKCGCDSGTPTGGPWGKRNAFTGTKSACTKELISRVGQIPGGRSPVMPPPLRRSRFGTSKTVGAQKLRGQGSPTEDSLLYVSPYGFGWAPGFEPGFSAPKTEIERQPALVGADSGRNQRFCAYRRQQALAPRLTPICSANPDLT